MKYFNLSAPKFRIKKYTLSIQLWTAFYNPDIQWGVGLLQINFWHLFFIGSDGFIICEDMRNAKNYGMK